jgi:hypothetical protein
MRTDRYLIYTVRPQRVTNNVYTYRKSTPSCSSDFLTSVSQLLVASIGRPKIVTCFVLAHSALPSFLGQCLTPEHLILLPLACLKPESQIHVIPFMGQLEPLSLRKPRQIRRQYLCSRIPHKLR